MPISNLAAIIKETKQDLDESGLTAPIVGHVGDGNFHLAILVDPEDADELQRAKDLNDRLVRRAIAYDGTCTGEHGVGYGKAAFLELEHGPQALAMMRAIKTALDPDGLFNPGQGPRTSAGLNPALRRVTLDARMESTTFRTLSDVVLAIAADHEVESVLQRIVDSARELGGARYAALGIPDGEGAFASFITSGMSDELIEAMGPLPRTHGMLGAMLQSPEPHLTDDITADPRFRGWWPRAHPMMRSFLGVPIVARGEIIGAIYLTVKEGGPRFTEEDQRLIELLAAHAAIAIENARLHERSRELSIVSERNRLARDLHDNVTQRLFGVKLAAESALTLLNRDACAAGVELKRVSDLAREAMEELRAVVFELRPASLEAEGLATVLRKHVEVLRRVTGQDIDLKVCEVPRLSPECATQVLRIAQEALGNALRHADATRIEVRLNGNTLTVTDDGVGFDPAGPEVRGQRLGLTSMEERAIEAGGSLTVRSERGLGTTVRLELAP